MHATNARPAPARRTANSTPTNAMSATHATVRHRANRVRRYARVYPSSLTPDPSMESRA